uniref:Reverse transcriptase domain-containing protein n=1 Tax=Arundo donax TaxID=35708 RepID=A0A0A9DTW6_ARUDO
MLLQHFHHQLGTSSQRAHALNWNFLDIQRHELSHLDEDLSEQEVQRAIQELPSEKAPGPDGYIGLFYKTCWTIVKHDLLGALNQIFNL